MGGCDIGKIHKGVDVSESHHTTRHWAFAQCTLGMWRKCKNKTYIN